MAQVGDHDQIESKDEALIALFPYAVLREQYGEGGMTGAFMAVIRALPSRLGTLTMEPLTAGPSNEGSPDSLNPGIKLMLTNALWYPLIIDRNIVTQWAAAALAAPYTEELSRHVADALLQIASLESLQPYIPIDVWVLLKKRPPLPPVCMGRSRGTMDCVVRGVRELGDPEILKSYFLLVWSEWNIISPEGLTNMHASIREDFGGIGTGHHREELAERLDYVLGQLDPGSEYLKQRRPWIDKDPQRTRRQYRELKETLMEVDRETTEILTRTPSRLTNLLNSLTQAGIYRNPLDVHMFPPAPIPVVARLQRSLRSPVPCFIVHGFNSVNPSSSKLHRSALQIHPRGSQYLQTVVIS